MPLLNDRGDVVAGAGGTQGSLNGMPYPFVTYGGGSWLDDATVLLQQPRPAPALGELGAWRPGDAAPVGWGAAANDWASRAGAWVAWLAGRGVFGSLEGRLPASLRAGLAKAGTLGPRAVAPDGTIAYVPDRQAGLGVRLVDPTGGIVDVPGVVAYSLQALGPGTAIWKGGAVGRPLPRPAAADAQGVILVTLSDGDWLVYWSESCGFVAQRDSDLDGYVLGREPLFFNHDARAVDGELTVAWSVTQGEAPGDVRLKVVDRSAPRVPIKPPPAEFPAVPPPSRPVHSAWFEFEPGAPGPGSARLLVRNHFGPQAGTIVVTDETASAVTGVVLGHFVSGASVEEIEARATRLHHRPIVYWDAEDWPRWPTLPRGSWCCVRAYMSKGADPAAWLEARLRAVRSCPYPVAVVGQQYTSNASLVGYVDPSTPPPHDSSALATIAPLLRRLTDEPNVLALLLFSGHGRRGGIDDHPDARVAWAAWASASAPPIEAWPPDETHEPQSTGDIMIVSQFDSTRVIPYKQLKSSATHGCVNVIMPDDRVLSAHGDDRDPGTDGPWEQGQVAGQSVTFSDGSKYYTYLIVPVDKVPA